jgi:hypothetical protein
MEMMEELKKLCILEDEEAIEKHFRHRPVELKMVLEEVREKRNIFPDLKFVLRITSEGAVQLVISPTY